MVAGVGPERVAPFDEEKRSENIIKEKPLDT